MVQTDRKLCNYHIALRIQMAQSCFKHTFTFATARTQISSTPFYNRMCRCGLERLRCNLTSMTQSRTFMSRNHNLSPPYERYAFLLITQLALGLVFRRFALSNANRPFISWICRFIFVRDTGTHEANDNKAMALASAPL